MWASQDHVLDTGAFPGHGNCAVAVEESHCEDRDAHHVGSVVSDPPVDFLVGIVVKLGVEDLDLEGARRRGFGPGCC